MIYVKNVDMWCKEAREAHVVISDGEFDILCFSQPCALEVNDVLTNEALIVFDLTEEVVRADYVDIYEVEKRSRTYEHFITGKLINAEEGLVQVGKIVLDIGGAPGDIKDGEFVSFTVLRVDVNGEAVRPVVW